MLNMSRPTVTAGCALLAVSVLHAQRGGADWMTIGNDAQRSYWMRGDGKISVESLKKPGFEVVWKFKIKNDARALSSITPPTLLDFYIGYRGFRSLGFVGSNSNKVTGIDIDLARLEWEQNLGPVTGAPAPTLPCPGGMTAGVARPTGLGYPPPGGGFGRGRGAGAQSGVGEPFEGAVQLKARGAQPPIPQVQPPKPASASRPRPVSAPPSPFGRGILWVNAISADGKLHSMYVSNGEEPNPAVPFVPANAHARGLLVADGTAYAATVNGCGGAPNGVWALDIASKKVTSWKSSENISGSTALAAGPEGMIYVAAGSELTALAPKTLEKQASYSAGPANFTSSPIVFEFKDRDLVAASTNDGRLHIVNGEKVTDGLAKSEPFSAPNFETGALASWQDAAGTRWILAPAAGSSMASAGFSTANGAVKDGAIVAWKVVENGGKIQLEPGWVSRNLVSPLTPLVINGVVFALSSGENREGATAADRAKKSENAVLYALDPQTGKEIWSSGKVITSFVHSGGLSGGGGRVYVGAHDGTQYAFGFPMEH